MKKTPQSACFGRSPVAFLPFCFRKNLCQQPLCLSVISAFLPIAFGLSAPLHDLSFPHGREANVALLTAFRHHHHVRGLCWKSSRSTSAVLKITPQKSISFTTTGGLMERLETENAQVAVDSTNRKPTSNQNPFVQRENDFFSLKLHLCRMAWFFDMSKYIAVLPLCIFVVVLVTYIKHTLLHTHIYRDSQMEL